MKRHGKGAIIYGVDDRAERLARKSEGKASAVDVRYRRDVFQVFDSVRCIRPIERGLPVIEGSLGLQI